MTDPAGYLLKQFENHKIIMLGEEHRVREQLEFVMELIPKLYKSGIRNIGMEFGCYELQGALDSLVCSDFYDEAAAREMMFTYNVAWPMKEYTDIYYKVWQLNQGLSGDEPRFRIINLSYQYDWSAFKGIRTIGNALKIFPKGPIEQFRARVVEKEVMSCNEKILILTGTPHAFTRYAYTVYDNLEEGLCRYIRKDFGHLLYAAYGDDVITVLFHQPFYKNGYPAAVSPCDGAVEKYLEQNFGHPVGLDLSGHEVGSFKVNSDYSFGYKDLRLRDLADGYIYLKPLHRLHGASLDKKFIEGYPYEKVIEQFPDPDWHQPPLTKDAYWTYMEHFTNLKEQWHRVFEED